MHTALPPAVVEQQALLTHRGDAGFGLCTGTGVEKADRRGEQVTVADLAGVAGRIDLLADADPAEALGAAVEVLELGLHLGQAFDDRSQLHA